MALYKMFMIMIMIMVIDVYILMCFVDLSFLLASVERCAIEIAFPSVRLSL